MVDRELLYANRRPANAALSIPMCIDTPEINHLPLNTNPSRPDFVRQLHPLDARRWWPTDILVFTPVRWMFSVQRCDFLQ
jgi:hypothetical protein